VRFLNTVNNINKWVGNVICYLVVVMTLTGVYEVGARYFFNRPTVWVWEANALVLSVFVALGGGYTLLVRGHVRVDIAYEHLSTRAKAITDAFTSCLIFLFLGILLWRSIEGGLLSLSLLERSQTVFRPPIYPFKLMLVVGIFLFLLQAISDFVRYIYIAHTGSQVNSGS